MGVHVEGVAAEWLDAGPGVIERMRIIADRQKTMRQIIDAETLTDDWEMMTA